MAWSQTNYILWLLALYQVYIGIGVYLKCHLGLSISRVRWFLPNFPPMYMWPCACISIAHFFSSNCISEVCIDNCLVSHLHEVCWPVVCRKPGKDTLWTLCSVANDLMKACSIASVAKPTHCWPCNFLAPGTKHPLCFCVFRSTNVDHILHDSYNPALHI